MIENYSYFLNIKNFQKLYENTLLIIDSHLSYIIIIIIIFYMNELFTIEPFFLQLNTLGRM